jgi:hypothetical protein
METLTGKIFMPVAMHAGKTFRTGRGAGAALCQSHRIKRCAAGKTRSEPLSVSMDGMRRIDALESELLQYRYMIETMVRQRTSRLDRRVALLKACNARLCDEFGKMRKKYLDLLSRVQGEAQGAILSDSPNAVDSVLTEPSGHAVAAYLSGAKTPVCQYENKIPHVNRRPARHEAAHESQVYSIAARTPSR